MPIITLKFAGKGFGLDALAQGRRRWLPVLNETKGLRFPNKGMEISGEFCEY